MPSHSTPHTPSPAILRLDNQVCFALYSASLAMTKLYKPLLEKVNNAMKDVATENGFTMVFDLSSNMVLYGDPSLDVTTLVKTKLGIN